MLLENVPVIKNRRELQKYLKPVYIISEEMNSYEDYDRFQNNILNIVRGCFTIYECRTFPVYFKFYLRDKKIYKLELRHFLINLFLWYPFVELNGITCFDESFILKDPEQIPHIEDYINEKLIQILNEYHIKTVKKNSSISKVLNNLRKISQDFSDILGIDFTVPMFVQLYDEYPRMKEMMETTFDADMQPHEIEEKLNILQKEEVALLKGIKDCPLSIVLRAGTGLKEKQLVEFTISEGLKPTLSGKTIPKPIESSTLIRGLDKPSYIMIDALAARKSLVMNKKVMGKAGHFGKKVTMLTRTLSMSMDTLDCGTKHLVKYDIDSKAKLKKFNGKYYKLINDPNEEYLVLNAKKDTHLIGSSIYVRSAACCTLGDKVCPRCVGQTAITNVDIADGLSAFESEEITKVVSQNILSSKHLLTTDSEEIRFSSDFYDFFTMIGGEVYPVINGNLSIDVDKYAIYIDPEDMEKIEDLDDDSLYNNMIVNGRFYIRNIEDPSEPDITIQCDDPEKEIYITKDFSQLMKKNKGLVYFSELDDDDKLFEVVIYNNELTKPLYSIMHLLDRKQKNGEEMDIDQISNEFLKLTIESKIKVNVVAIELIINRLIRSIERPYERPDFSQDVIEPYELITVSKALEKNKSPLIGLSFQYIKRQLISDDLYTVRDGVSYMDSFYKEQISTKNLKDYSKYASSDAMSEFIMS